MPVKIRGLTNGSVTVAAPDTGSDVTLTLPGTTMNLATELASKLPIAGGKILQIVRATDSTQRTTTSATFVDASISVTITPQKSDSVVIVINSFYYGTDAVNMYSTFQITDNSNNAISGAERAEFGNTSTVNDNATAVLIGYATPATTSAVTYKLRFRQDSLGTQTNIIKNNINTGQMYAIEVSA